MTSFAVRADDTPSNTHFGEMILRRFRAGELPADHSQRIVQHAAACVGCRSRLRALDEEQTQFEQDIPFARFSGGVERALRVPRQTPRHAWTAGMATIAALAAAWMFVARPVVQRVPTQTTPLTSNRLKGADGYLAQLRVAAADGSHQRTATMTNTETLQAGERIRIGFRASADAFVVVASLDEAGVVTVLHPEIGETLFVKSQPVLAFLPGSHELTGAGRERVFLAVLDKTSTVQEFSALLREAYQQSHGDLVKLALPVGPNARTLETFSWMLQKP